MVDQRSGPALLRIALSGLAVALVSCYASDHRGSETVSPGEVTREDIETARRIRVSERPLLRIGVLDGPEELQLQRVADVKLTSDRIYVLDGGARTIRAFDRSGGHVESFGREGDGPGEFRYPADILTVGDSLVAVWDRQLHRLTVFSASGEVLHTAQVPENMANPRARAVFDDGSFLIADVRPGFPDPGESERVGSTHVVRYARDGALLDTLTVLRSSTMVRAGLEVGMKPFASNDYVESDDESVWIVRSDTAVAVRLTREGDTVGVLRWQTRNREVTGADVEAYFAYALQIAGPSARGGVEAVQRSGITAERLPALTGFLVDGLGRPWVRDLSRPWSPSEHPWVVFTAEGGVVMMVLVPEGGISVYDTDGEYIATVERDDLGVQRVAIYRLLPREGS